MTQDGYVDGNALAGPLGEIFTAEVTQAGGRCLHCGLTLALAAVRVYDRAPGLVGRCPGCEEVLLRLVRTPDAAWLDLSGLSALRVALPAD